MNEQMDLGLARMSDNLKNGNYACWWLFFAQHSFVHPDGSTMEQGYMSHDAQESQDSVWANINENKMERNLSSVITGSGCWLRLYSEENCTGHVLSFGPNSAISDLSQFDLDGDDWNNQAKSFRAYYREPDDGWSESTPKDGALKQRYAADKRADAAWSMLKSVVQIGVLAIPVAGEALDESMTVGVFLANTALTLWPSGPTDDRIAQDIRAWILMQTYKLYSIDQDIFTTTSLSNLRDKLYDTVSWNTDGKPKTDEDGDVIYSTAKVEELLSQIDACCNEIDAGGPEYWQLSTIHYTAIVATVAAFTWRLGLRIEFDENSNAPNKCLSGLKDRLPKLIGYLRDGPNQAQDLRTALVEMRQSVVQQHENETYNCDWWIDTYAGYYSAYYDPVDQDATRHRDFYIANVLTPNLINDWDMVRELADALEYWSDPDFASGDANVSLPKVTVRSKTGMFGDIRADTDNFPIKWVTWDLSPNDQIAIERTSLSYGGEYDDEDMVLGLTPWSKIPVEGEPDFYQQAELGSLGFIQDLEWGATLSIKEAQRFAGTVGTRGYARNCVGSCVVIGTDDKGESGQIKTIGGKSEHMPFGWSASPPDASNGLWCGIWVQQNPQSGGATSDYWAAPLGQDVDLRANAIRNIGFLWRFDRVIPKGTSPTKDSWLEDVIKR